jgi:hypothetical protein
VSEPILKVGGDIYPQRGESCHQLQCLQWTLLSISQAPHVCTCAGECACVFCRVFLFVFVCLFCLIFLGSNARSLYICVFFSSSAALLPARNWIVAALPSTRNVADPSQKRTL